MQAAVTPATPTPPNFYSPPPNEFSLELRLLPPTCWLVLGLFINCVKFFWVDFRMGGLKVVKNGSLSLCLAPEMEEVLGLV